MARQITLTLPTDPAALAALEKFAADMSRGVASAAAAARIEERAAARAAVRASTVAALESAFTPAFKAGDRVRIAKPPVYAHSGGPVGNLAVGDIGVVAYALRAGSNAHIRVSGGSLRMVAPECLELAPQFKEGDKVRVTRGPWLPDMEPGTGPGGRGVWGVKVGDTGTVRRGPTQSGSYLVVDIGTSAAGQYIAPECLELVPAPVPAHEIRAGDRVVVTAERGSEGVGRGFVADHFTLGTVATVLGKSAAYANAWRIRPVVAPGGGSQALHPDCLSRVDPDTAPLKVGDRVVRTGPHKLAETDSDYFGDLECKLGDVGTVTRLPYSTGGSGSVRVKWDARKSSAIHPVGLTRIVEGPAPVPVEIKAGDVVEVVKAMWSNGVEECGPRISVGGRYTVGAAADPDGDIYLTEAGFVGEKNVRLVK